MHQKVVSLGCLLQPAKNNKIVRLYSVSEKLRLREKLDRPVFWFTPTQEQTELYGDGGLAIIDQWIAAHARYTERSAS